MKLASEFKERSKHKYMPLGNTPMHDATGFHRSATKTARKRSLISFLPALILWFGAVTLLAQTVAKEYRIKAAYLFNFSQYVEWPPDAFKDANDPLTYCTIGDDPFQGMLDESLNAKSAGKHPLRVQHLRPPENFQACQILFIGTNEKKRVAEVLETLKQSPVLVVGESSHFVQQGGTVGFLSEDNTIRFEVNLDAAQRARLNISATLLSVAKTVIGTAGGK
jgi:YfiR/HmsC-like